MLNVLKKRHRKHQMCYAQIIIILILFHQSHYCNFKWFYRKHVSKRLTDTFPNLVQYIRLIQLQKSIFTPLYYLLQTLKRRRNRNLFYQSSAFKSLSNKV